MKKSAAVRVTAAPILLDNILASLRRIRRSCEVGETIKDSSDISSGERIGDDNFFVEYFGRVGETREQPRSPACILCALRYGRWSELLLG